MVPPGDLGVVRRVVAAVVDVARHMIATEVPGTAVREREVNSVLEFRGVEPRRGGGLPLPLAGRRKICGGALRMDCRRERCKEQGTVEKSLHPTKMTARLLRHNPNGAGDTRAMRRCSH